MKPLDPDLQSLLREWVEKAEADLEAAAVSLPAIMRYECIIASIGVSAR